MDSSDQRRVSHVNPGHGFQRAVPHGEGVQLAADVPRPHLTVAVAHAQQVRAELREWTSRLFSHSGSNQDGGRTSEGPHACAYLDSLQVFPGPAVVHGRRAVLTSVDDVLVISSKTHDVFVETETLYQRLSSCRRQPDVSINQCQ